MFDCHYDLLSFIYIYRNDIEEVKQHCEKIFKNNIKGGIFNLFYMSPEEMYEELGVEQEEIDIISNLKEVKEIIKKNNLIPEYIDYKIGIEGLDYLRNIEEIDVLYDLGVRSVNPVWNNHNKFGTGVRPIRILNKKKGLTKLGEELIIKLIEKKIAIDLSHADEETFWDIIEICKEYKNLSPKVLASHSNCKSICDVPRNLSDKQIIEIAKLGGMIGIVGVKIFCSKENKENYEADYIKHIIHIKKLLGNARNIVLSSDDISYYKIEPEYYKNFNVFKQEMFNEKIKKLLKENHFSENEVEDIKYGNYIRFWKNV